MMLAFESKGKTTKNSIRDIPPTKNFIGQNFDRFVKQRIPDAGIIRNYQTYENQTIKQGDS